MSEPARSLPRRLNLYAPKIGDRPRALLALALLLVLVLAPNWPILLRGANLVGSDVTSALLPLRSLVDESLRAGRLPLWSPEVYCGYPLLAESQLGTFNPVQLLLALVTSSARAFALSLIVHLALAAVVAYGLARRLGANRPASVLAGAAYTIGGACGAHQQVHPCMAAGYWALPAAILVVDHLRGARAPALWAYLWGLTLALGLLMAQPQMAFLAGLYSSVYLIAIVSRRDARWRARSVGLCLLMLLLGLGLASIQVLPTMEFGQQSWRAAMNRLAYVTWYGFPFPQFAALLAPPLSGWSPGPFSGPGRAYWGAARFSAEAYACLGLAALLLAALAAGRWREPRVRGLLAVLTVSLLLMPGPGNPVYLALQYVPGFNQFRVPARHLFGVGIAISMLAGLGLTWLTNRSAKTPSLRPAWALAAVAGALYLLVVTDVIALPPASVRGTHPQERFLLLRDIAVLAGLLVVALGVIHARARRGFSPAWTQGLLLALTVGELFYFFPQMSEFVPRSFYQEPPPVVREAVAAAGDRRCLPLEMRWGPTHEQQALEGSAPTLWGLRSVTGYAALSTERACRVFQKNILGRWAGQDPPAGLLAALDVGVVICCRELTTPGLELAYRDGDFRVYRNTTGLGDAWFTETWTVMSHDQAFHTVISAGFSPTRVAILEERPPMSSRPVQGGSVVTLRREPTRLVLRTSTERPQVLAISQAWYPGWVARIDGQPTTLYRANYLLCAGRVPPGEHEVALTYEPASFRRGRALSLLSGAAGLCAVGVMLRRRRRRRRQPDAAAH